MEAVYLGYTLTSASYAVRRITLKEKLLAVAELRWCSFVKQNHTPQELVEAFGHAP